MAQILIITSSGQEGNDSLALVHFLAGYWRARGHSVVIGHAGAQVEADVAFVHVDQTTVPETILKAASRYPRVINGACASVRKDLYSRQRLRRGQSYSGPVVVKTRNNFGGLPETEEIDEAQLRSARQGPWNRRSVLPPANYPIFRHMTQVPTGVWDNPELMVEKLLSELDEKGRYVLRHWYFFGDREAHEKQVSRRPIVKNLNTPEEVAFYTQYILDHHDTEESAPEALHALRRELKLDYGRIDWALHEGAPVIYDVNKTMAGSNVPLPDPEAERLLEAAIGEFARGIDFFL